MQYFSEYICEIGIGCCKPSRKMYQSLKALYPKIYHWTCSPETAGTQFLISAHSIFRPPMILCLQKTKGEPAMKHKFHIVLTTQSHRLIIESLNKIWNESIGKYNMVKNNGVCCALQSNYYLPCLKLPEKEQVHIDILGQGTWMICKKTSWHCPSPYKSAIHWATVLWHRRTGWAFVQVIKTRARA